jgi:hypothetical protein
LFDQYFGQGQLFDQVELHFLSRAFFTFGDI